MEEYVKINLERYDNLKNMEQILDKIKDSIEYFSRYYNENDKEVEYNPWGMLGANYKEVKTLNIDIKQILNALNLDKSDFDIVNINGT
jgi:hypothetical protein